MRAQGPLLLGGEEYVRVLRVELERLTDVRPAQRARRKRQPSPPLFGRGEEEPEESVDEDGQDGAGG